MTTLALLLALLLTVGSWFAFARAAPVLRGGMLTMTFAFALWYWLPAVNVLVLHYAGAGSFAVPAAAATHAAWLVLGYQATMLLAQRGLARWCRIDEDEAARQLSPTLTWLGATVLLSSLALVFVRFDDPVLSMRILGGATSARDHLTFFNRSSGAAESLTKLWEILNLWTALFVLAAAVDARRLLGAAALMTIAALVVGFLGSGTRAVLLMAGFTVVAAATLRPATSVASRPSRLGLAVLAGLLLLAATALGGRFRDGIGPIVADTLLVNTDMLSETAFALDRLRGWQPARVADFVLTPFSFLLPRFLGVDKTTPEHLVVYNRIRAGYDIVHGEGNVFPGIVADFHLVWGGFAGAALFALFVIAVIAAVEAFGHGLAAGPVRRAWRIAVYAFLLVSVRNIQGSLVLVMLVGLIIAYSMQRLDRRA